MTGKDHFTVNTLLFVALAAALAISLTCGSLVTPTAGRGGLLTDASIPDLGSPLFNSLTAYASMLLVCCCIVTLNKHFNILQTTAPLGGLSFVALCCLCFWTLCLPCSGWVMGVVNIISLWMVFDTVPERPGTPQAFIAATAWGWMVALEYSAVAMGFTYMLVFLIFKQMRLREFCAYLAGFATPLWIMAGTGLVSFPLAAPDISIEMLHIGDNTLPAILIGITGLAAFIACMSNTVRLFSAKLRRRQINASLMLVWGVTLLLTLIDLDNYTTYTPMLLTATAMQTGMALAFERRR